MDIPQLASRVRFVLCEPAHPGNIGSAARAIKTMGFRDLRVVAPREPGYRTHEEAVAYATSSVDVLEASRMHDTLAEALEGVTFAWALTGYDREFGPPMSPLRPAAERSVAWLDEMEGDIAFVFGTERSGMTNEEVMLCQGCAAIAADCAAYSCDGFRERYMAGRVTLIGCPKLDGVDYAERLAALFAGKRVRSVALARMSVPCCGGLERAARLLAGMSGAPLEITEIPCG